MCGGARGPESIAGGGKTVGASSRERGGSMLLGGRTADAQMGGESGREARLSRSAQLCLEERREDGERVRVREGG